MWFYGAVKFYYLVITEEGLSQADSTAHMAADLCGQSAHKTMLQDYCFRGESQSIRKAKFKTTAKPYFNSISKEYKYQLLKKKNMEKAAKE